MRFSRCIGTSLVLVGLMLSECSSQDAQLSRKVEICERLRGVAETDSFASCYQYPETTDYAESLADNSAPDLKAIWAKYFYRDSSSEDHGKNTLQASLEVVKRDFPMVPIWWQETFLSCVIDERGCGAFRVVKDESNQDRGSLIKNALLEVETSTPALPIQVSVSDFSLGKPIPSLATTVQYDPSHKYARGLFVGTYDGNVSQKLNLWSFTSDDGRLLWMQAVDFNVSRKQTAANCKKEENEGKVSLAVNEIWSDNRDGIIRYELCVFGAWSGSMLICKFSEGGTPLYVFNTGLFPTYKSDEIAVPPK